MKNLLFCCFHLVVLCSTFIVPQPCHITLRLHVEPPNSELDNVQLTKKLRKSLTDSATFKIKNDARFTWLSLSLTAALYSGFCIGASPLGGSAPKLISTTQSSHIDEIHMSDFMEIFNIPNLGLPGGVIAAVLSAASFKLFLNPILTRK